MIVVPLGLGGFYLSVCGMKPKLVHVRVNYRHQDHRVRRWFTASGIQSDQTEIFPFGGKHIKLSIFEMISSTKELGVWVNVSCNGNTQKLYLENEGEEIFVRL